MLIAVYWKLKKKFGNHRVMEMVEWEYIKDDYIEFTKMTGCDFPMVEFGDSLSSQSKYLFIEIYEVDKKWVEWLLDSLEGYYWEGSHNLYNRIQVQTLSWETVYVYDINREIKNDEEQWFSHEDDGKLFYNWY